jgi:hypothetical protein
MLQTKHKFHPIFARMDDQQLVAHRAGVRTISLKNSRMTGERILDLARVDVLPARYHVLEAIHHEDNAILIGFTDVAGVQITAA